MSDRLDGLLEKSGGFLSYRSHYFRVENGVLEQYNADDRKGSKLKKTIELSDGKVTADPKDLRIFHLHVKKKKYLFRAKNEAECTRWMKGLKPYVQSVRISRSGGSASPLSLRSLVSRKKIRYTEDGFNLDLTYITDSLIAMGYPAGGVEAFYRNSLSKVKKMLNSKHPGSYKVYNLCSEKTYDAKHFHQHGHFPFSDHNTCPLKLIKDFCEDVHMWLQGQPKRVAAIHCKAGKGRAGMMISCYLVRSGICPDAKSALELFGKRRCYDEKGVTIPSQIRYVEYYNRYVKEFVNKDVPFPFDASRTLVHVRINTVPGFNRGRFQPYLLIQRYDDNDELVTVYNSAKHHEPVETKPSDPYIDIPTRAEMKGDMKLVFMESKTQKKLFWGWVNGAFCPENGIVEFKKTEIDGTYKENKSKFAEGFGIRLYFGMNQRPRDSGASNSGLTSPSARRGGNIFRKLVSKKKVRFKQNGFDLDLTYITPKLIAMGYPSEGMEELYRNPMSEVQKMLKTYHPARFKVYNLCAERTYDPEKFGGQSSCAHYPFFDHNACPLRTVVDMCADVDAFLKAGDDHVVAIHCKAGKGRTGMMIACYLLYSGVCETADDALDMFAEKRTADGKGVTIASQRRYVHYFERYVREYHIPKKPFNFSATKLLYGVRFAPVPDFDIAGGCTPYFRIFNADMKKVFDSREQVKCKSVKGASCSIDVKTLLTGDCKIVFYNRDKLSKDDKIFWMWLNTELEGNRIRIQKYKIDGASKKYKKNFSDDFYVELQLEEIKRRRMRPQLLDDINQKKGGKRKKEGKLPPQVDVVSADKRLDVFIPNKSVVAVKYPITESAAIARVGAWLAETYPGKHKVYNLGADPIYDAKKYGGELVRYQIDDQSPAKMMLMVQVCEDIAKYTKGGEGRVAAVHCNAGKGFMVCACYQLFCGRAKSARNAIRQVSQAIQKYKSSGDKMAPGQTACVENFAKLLKEYYRPKIAFPTTSPPRNLLKIVIHTIPNVASDGVGFMPNFVVMKDRKQLYNMQVKSKQGKDELKVRIQFGHKVSLSGLNQICFYQHQEKKPLFWFWIHTQFLGAGEQRVFLEKSKVDNACNDASCSRFHEEFIVEMLWEEMEDGADEDEDEM